MELETNEMIRQIETLTELEQLKFQNSLNSWEYPKDLLQKFKPDWWDNIPEGKCATHRHYEYISPITNYFRKKFGKKKCLWYHNTIGRSDKMSEIDFENWWNEYGSKNLLQ